jgi:Cytochrome oxidase complex assembly protein 1
MNQSSSNAWLQRNWKWLLIAACSAILLIIVGVISAMIYGVSSIMKSSDVYQMAVTRAKHDPNVIANLGEPIVDGFFSSGHINTMNSSGDADLDIPISGPKGEASIYVIAKKTLGKWAFSDLVVEISKTKNRIDLMKSEEIQHE